MKNTFAVDRTQFEVYLEGVEIPFNSLSLQERAGGFPQLSLTLPFTQPMAHLLDRTIVQAFGPDPLSQRKILIFEGQIQSINYSKQEGSRVIQISCDHILAQWKEIKIRPKDALIPPNYSNAEGASLDESIYVESDTPQNIPHLIKKSLQGALESLGGETLKKILKKVSLSSTGAMQDELIQLLATDEVKKGDIGLIIDYFQTKFTQNDIFWGIKASAYDVRASVLAFPNPGKIDTFKNKLVKENIKALAQDLGTSLQRGDIKFLQALGSFLQSLFFSFQIPAIPLALPAIKKSNWKEETYDIPLRAIFTPSLDHTPPPLCNVFFPNQYSTFNYSRGFRNEPTRTIGSFKAPLANGLQGFKGVWPFHVYPAPAFNEEDAKKNLINFTAEESYKGVKLQEKNYSYMLGKPATKALKEWAQEQIPDKEAEDQITEGAKKGKNFDPIYKESLTQLTANNHVGARLATRQCSISGDWNPYRLIGYTAIILDDGGPSVFGSLAGQNLSISAEGQISTSYTLATPRLITKDTVIESEVEDDDPLAKRIHPDSLEPVVDINPFLFDSELYSFFNIGKEIYPLILRGLIGKESKLQEYTKEGNAFTSFSSNALKITEKNIGDISLLRWVKEDQITTDIPQYLPSAYLRNGAKNLLKEYHTFDSAHTQIGWVFNINKRKLLDRDTYFKELGINPKLGPSDPIYTLDAATLLTGSGSLSKVAQLVKTHVPVAKDTKDKELQEVIVTFETILDSAISHIRNMLPQAKSDDEVGFIIPRLKEDLNFLTQNYQGDLQRVYIATGTSPEAPKGPISYKDEMLSKLEEAVKSSYWDSTEMEYIEEKLPVYYAHLKRLVELQNDYSGVKEAQTQQATSALKTEVKYKTSPALEVEYKKPYNLTRQLHVKKALESIYTGFGMGPYGKDSKQKVNIVK